MTTRLYCDERYLLAPSLSPLETLLLFSLPLLTALLLLSVSQAASVPKLSSGSAQLCRSDPRPGEPCCHLLTAPLHAVMYGSVRCARVQAWAERSVALNLLPLPG